MSGFLALCETKKISKIKGGEGVEAKKVVLSSTGVIIGIENVHD